MKKTDFFIAAIKARAFSRREWVISVFSMIKPNGEDWHKDLWDYKVVRAEKGNSGAYYFVDPENPSNLIPIEDSNFSMPIFKATDPIELSPGDLPNIKEKITSTIGLFLANALLTAYPFNGNVEYINKRFGVGDVEKAIVTRMEDDPENESEFKSDHIYVRDYLNFSKAAFYLTNFSQLFIPAASEKALTVSPEMKKLREELIAMYKDKLDDPAVLAKMEEEMIKLDKEWIKGDESEGFLIKGKHFNIVRKKLFMWLGAEEGLKPTSKADGVLTPLQDGWDVEKMPTMITVLRAGSFNRGAQTALAGEKVKWMFRASSNIRVTDDDCGSKLGLIRSIDEKNASTFIGQTVIEGSKQTKITIDNFKSYIGKTLMVRSPMYCRLDKTDYCKCCVGDRLAEHPTGLSVAVADYGSVFLGIFLAAMHGKQLSVAKIDINSSIV